MKFFYGVFIDFNRILVYIVNSEVNLYILFFDFYRGKFLKDFFILIIVKFNILFDGYLLIFSDIMG